MKAPMSARAKALLSTEEGVRKVYKYILGGRVIESKDKPVSALDTQISGDHYKQFKIQPVEYIHANGLGFCQGNVIKYVTRYKSKGGASDLEKAKHFIDLLIEFESHENKAT